LDLGLGYGGPGREKGRCGEGWRGGRFGLGRTARQCVNYWLTWGIGASLGWTWLGSAGTTEHPSHRRYYILEGG
jgi:hypothetical protein